MSYYGTPHNLLLVSIQTEPNSLIAIFNYYATETYFTHFLEEARFPKALGFSEA